MKQPYFTGPFAAMCEQFVTQKRALGYDYTQQAMLLRMFDNFSKSFVVEPYVITEELALAWYEKRPNEANITRYGRVMEMQRFAEYLGNQGYPSFAIKESPIKSSTHSPYIFTKDEIHRLFSVLDALPFCAASPTRHIVMPMLFRVLYGCGLRISEALALRISDVNFSDGIIHVYHGKNGRERLVPMSPSLAKQCATYADNLLADKAPSDYFFFHMLEEPYSRSSIKNAFRGFLWDAGIAYLGKDRGPSVHDIRHTFVCHRLNQWALDGVDLTVVLPILSKYLGHTSITATEWYLRLTAEVYPEVIKKMDKFTAGIYPKPWEVTDCE